MLDKEKKNNNVCGNEEHKYQNSKKYKSFQILCCSNFSFTKYCVDTQCFLKLANGLKAVN